MRLLGLVMQNSNTFKNLIQQIQIHPLIQIQVLNIYTASNSQIGALWITTFCIYSVIWNKRFIFVIFCYQCENNLYLLLFVLNCCTFIQYRGPKIYDGWSNPTDFIKKTSTLQMDWALLVRRSSQTMITNSFNWVKIPNNNIKYKSKCIPISICFHKFGVILKILHILCSL